MEDEKKYPVKHHVSTGPFSFFEIDVEATIENAVKQGKWLNAQFKSEER